MCLCVCVCVCVSECIWIADEVEAESTAKHREEATAHTSSLSSWVDVKHGLSHSWLDPFDIQCMG